MLKKILAPVVLLTLPVMAQQWTQEFPAASPPPTAYHGLAYDAAHSRTVLFGGATSAGVSHDTWLWDGSNWTQPSVANSPPADMPGLATAPGGVLLFGLNSVNGASVTWLWDGTGWTDVTPADSPSPSLRMFFAMAYDSNRNRVVLFGGADPINYPNALGDTWEWDGTNWTQVASSGPPARMGASMAYDAVHHEVVLFGGYNSGGDDESWMLNDTWVWNGTQWAQKTSSPATPPARYFHVMACDAAAGQVVLFGGVDASANTTGDTWMWDGSAWTQRTVTPSPEARGAAAMAYDAARQQIVLFGGATGGIADLADTWVWSGAGPAYAALVRQPINPDGSSAFKANRGVIPVKFTLTENGLPTCTLPPATIAVARTEGGTIGNVDESVYTMAADSGPNFRIDQPNCQYVYNLAASSLGVGTYEVTILINSAAVGTATFTLK